MIAVFSSFDIFAIFLQLMKACFLFNNCSMSVQQIITWKILMIALLFVSVLVTYVAKSFPFLFKPLDIRESFFPSVYSMDYYKHFGVLFVKIGPLIVKFWVACNSASQQTLA